MRHKTAIAIRKAVMSVPEKYRPKAYRQLKRLWPHIPHNKRQELLSAKAA
jgi:hypothetical protein